LYVVLIGWLMGADRYQLEIKAIFGWTGRFLMTKSLRIKDR